MLIVLPYRTAIPAHPSDSKHQSAKNTEFISPVVEFCPQAKANDAFDERSKATMCAEPNLTSFWENTVFCYVKRNMKMEYRKWKFLLSLR